MNGRIVGVLLGIGLLGLLSGSLFAQERWVYRYNGPADTADCAYSVVFGSDGNIYVAGESHDSVTGLDFTVVSLTDSGGECWVYRYDGPGNLTDRANSIVMGADGNLYAAGSSVGSGTLDDFTVISLTNSGFERWVYRYNGPGDGEDWAKSIVPGPDSNVYAAGRSQEIGGSCDFTVVSLMESGFERWVYGYDGPASGNDWANSIVMGSDGNLYVAGFSWGSGTYSDFTVVSLMESGFERWVYRYDGPASEHDEGNSIVMGSDGNLYAAGLSVGIGTLDDFTVISLTDSGTERWVYRYNGFADGEDWANSIVMGSDGNLYAAGYSEESGTLSDFTVVSLTDSGTERWVYRYNGPGDGRDRANSIVMGSDGNLYVAGYSWGSGTFDDFTVVSLTDTGTERWVYRYNGPGNLTDRANSIVVGSDDNLYAGGSSVGSGTYSDLTVISLTADVGVEEGRGRSSVADLRLWQNCPNPFHRSTLISYSLPQATHVTLAIYDIAGRLVEILVDKTQQSGIHHVDWNRKSNTSGVYFYTLRAGESVETGKMVVVD